MPEFLGPLLRTLAETLDVREIFDKIAAEARRLVPHEFLFLGRLTEGRERIEFIAFAGELPEGLTSVAIQESHRPTV
jgi:hypothetical protein